MRFQSRYYFLIWSTSLILISHCQQYRPKEEDCKKYCFEDCDKYKGSARAQLWIWSIQTRSSFKYNGSEHTDCVTANLLCECRSRFNWKNPFVISALVIIGILGVFGIHRVYRKCKNNRDYGWGYPRTPRLHPVGPSINAISTSNYGGFGTQVHNQSGATILSPEKPPEYLPPPSYNEVTEKGIK